MTVAVRAPLRRAKSAPANHDGALIVIALGFLIRVGVAFWNAYLGPSFGAEGDALEFHLRAVELVQQGDLGEFALGWVYAQYLALVYGLTGESLLIGSLLSCLAWLASAALLIGMARALGLGWRATFTAALIYAVMPTSILHTGVTLREAYQLLFVNLACWSGLRILARDSAANWLLLVVGCLGMAVLHGALAGFAGALLASLILIRRHRVQSRLHSRGRLPSLSVAVLVLGLVVWALSMLFPALQAELMMSLIQSQQGYISSEARAQYRTEFDLDGIVGEIDNAKWHRLQR